MKKFARMIADSWWSLDTFGWHGRLARVLWVCLVLLGHTAGTTVLLSLGPTLQHYTLALASGSLASIYDSVHGADIALRSDTYELLVSGIIPQYAVIALISSVHLLTATSSRRLFFQQTLILAIGLLLIDMAFGYRELTTRFILENGVANLVGAAIAASIILTIAVINSWLLKSLMGDLLTPRVLGPCMPITVSTLIAFFFYFAIGNAFLTTPVTVNGTVKGAFSGDLIVEEPDFGTGAVLEAKEPQPLFRLYGASTAERKAARVVTIDENDRRIDIFPEKSAHVRAMLVLMIDCLDEESGVESPKGIEIFPEQDFSRLEVASVGKLGESLERLTWHNEGASNFVEINGDSDVYRIMLGEQAEAERDLHLVLPGSSFLRFVNHEGEIELRKDLDLAASDGHRFKPSNIGLKFSAGDQDLTILATPPDDLTLDRPFRCRELDLKNQDMASGAVIVRDAMALSVILNVSLKSDGPIVPIRSAIMAETNAIAGFLTLNSHPDYSWQSLSRLPNAEFLMLSFDSSESQFIETYSRSDLFIMSPLQMQEGMLQMSFGESGELLVRGQSNAMFDLNGRVNKTPAESMDWRILSALLMVLVTLLTVWIRFVVGAIRSDMGLRIID